MIKSHLSKKQLSKNTYISFSLYFNRMHSWCLLNYLSFWFSCYVNRKTRAPNIWLICCQCGYLRRTWIARRGIIKTIMFEQSFKIVLWLNLELNRFKRHSIPEPCKIEFRDRKRKCHKHEKQEQIMNSNFKLYNLQCIVQWSTHCVEGENWCEPKIITKMGKWTLIEL